MYKIGGSAPSSSTASVITSTSSSALPTVTGLPTGWKYDGCYTEGTGGRALSFGPPDSQANSVETCIQACIGLGYTIAGVEYGTQCFCDNVMKNGPVRAPETDCSFPCPGNPSEKCGAGNRLNVYNTGNLTIYSVPVTQTTNLPGSWQYSGCIT
jgi:WSC domain